MINPDVDHPIFSALKEAQAALDRYEERRTTDIEARRRAGMPLVSRIDDLEPAVRALVKAVEAIGQLQLAFLKAEVRKLDPSPDDIVVINVRDVMPQRMMSAFRRHFHATYPELKAMITNSPNVIDLAIMHPQDIGALREELEQAVKKR